MRRVMGMFAVAASVALGSAAFDTWAGPGCGGCGGPGGCAKGSGPRGATSMAEVRDTFHALLGDHEKISRAVEEIEGGVATTTLSEDPAIAKTIRVHVRQMQARVEAGDGLRHWDPLFVEVFKHHDEIVMAIEDVPGGVVVRETSKNPDVTKLIRAHAKAVSEFAQRGFERAHEASPLPEGYPAPRADSTN
jgi:hypothetical protein